MKTLYEYINESISSYLFDLKDENMVAEIQQAIDNNDVIATIDADKKVIKSDRIYICDRNGNTVVWLSDTKRISSPNIYLIPNKEWKFVTSKIIIAPNKPIDGSLINLEGSPKIKRVSLMTNANSTAMDCLKDCTIETFSVELGRVKPGFETLLNKLKINRMEYEANAAHSGIFFDPKATLNCKELAINGCKYMVSSWSNSKKGDRVTKDNCPCIPELTLLLSNNPQLNVIINWQSNGTYAQAKIEDGKLVFNQLYTDKINMAFKKCD